MKNTKPFLLSAILLLTVTFSFASSGDEKLTKENINTKTQAEINLRVEILKDRLEEIKTTDFSSLDKVEKRGLKKELKDIKKELKTAGSYVTISVGALIIIILLLIIIL